MNFAWQELIVAIAVAWAAWRALLALRGTLAQTRSGACGGGCCGKSKEAGVTPGGQQLFEIDARGIPGQPGPNVVKQRS